MNNVFASPRLRKNVAWLQIATIVFFAIAQALMLNIGRADAYTGDIVDNRIITMEESTASATGVEYNVSFDVATTHTIASVVLQYCDTSPIIGDSVCGDTRSANGAGTFDWNDSGATVNSGLGASTVDTANSDAVTWILDVDTPASVSATTTVDFTLSSVVNPNVTNSSFYVRILTFDNASNAESYVVGTDTNVVDAGGIALSTANNITLTAKVQETLVFCVYTGANCGAGGTDVSLGDANDVLSTSTTYTDANAQFDLGTNATSGAKVYMSGGLLTSGSNDIDSIGSSCTADATGSEQFGLRVTDDGSANTNVSATTPYDCTTGQRTFDTAQMALATNPWGDEIAETTVPTETEDSAIEFGANISNLTPAGIYTATYDLVAAPQY